MVIETRINTGSDQNGRSNQDGEDKADVRSIKAGESRGLGNLLDTWGRQQSVVGPQDAGFMEARPHDREYRREHRSRGGERLRPWTC